MAYILGAALGVATARWFSWFGVVAIALILAVAVGIEGAVHARPFLKVLKRGLELNATFEGAYLAQTFLLVYGPRLLRRSGE